MKREFKWFLLWLIGRKRDMSRELRQVKIRNEKQNALEKTVNAINRDMEFFLPIVGSTIKSPFPLNYVFIENGERVEVNLMLSVKRERTGSHGSK